MKSSATKQRKWKTKNNWVNKWREIKEVKGHINIHLSFCDFTFIFLILVDFPSLCFLSLCVCPLIFWLDALIHTLINRSITLIGIVALNEGLKMFMFYFQTLLLHLIYFEISCVSLPVIVSSTCPGSQFLPLVRGSCWTPLVPDGSWCWLWVVDLWDVREQT